MPAAVQLPSSTYLPAPYFQHAGRGQTTTATQCADSWAQNEQLECTGSTLFFCLPFYSNFGSYRRAAKFLANDFMAGSTDIRMDKVTLKCKRHTQVRWTTWGVGKVHEARWTIDRTEYLIYICNNVDNLSAGIDHKFAYELKEWKIKLNGFCRLRMSENLFTWHLKEIIKTTCPSPKP